MSQVTLCPYSPHWPKVFAQEQAVLASVFEPMDVVVEHIGSTAVPGLVAKPVIDIVLGAPGLALIDSRIKLLSAAGYEYINRYEDQLPSRRYFVKHAPSSNRIHLHGVELGSEIWRNHLAFRDRLRSDARLRARYEALKLGLAAGLADDKAAYTEAKGPFIQAVLAGQFADGRPYGGGVP